MFYLIRGKEAKDVLGIFNTREVIPFPITVSTLNQLLGIIEWNLSLGPAHWDIERISQAEFETYRDLHEFRVLKRYTPGEWTDWLRGLANQMRPIE